MLFYEHYHPDFVDWWWRNHIYRRNGGGPPENGPAEGAPGPDVLNEEFVDRVVGTVLAHLYLFENDLPFALDFGRGKSRVEKDVGETVQAPLNVLHENIEVVAGELATGEGVEVAPEGVYFPCQSRGGPGRRALAEKMLNEVSTPSLSYLLGARPGADEHPECDRTAPGDRLRDDTDTARKDGSAE